MLKYGFFGGSFNPVTNAHIELAIEIIDKYKLDKIVFVPVGDCYNKQGLINEQHRFNMLKIATNKYSNLEVSDIELNKNKNLTVLEAFELIDKEYVAIEKYYILGEDNLYKIISSKDSKKLIENYKYIIIQRNTMNYNEFIKDKGNNFIFMENVKHKNTSSTKVRQGLLEEKEKLDDIMNVEVLEYIKENNLYKLNEM